MSLVVALAAAASMLSAPQMTPSLVTRLAEMPNTALMGNRQGAVVFSVAVDAQGKPTKCVVERIIEYDFGDLVCKRLMNASYKPATDAGGKPVAGTLHSVTNFWMPKGEHASNFPFVLAPDMTFKVKAARQPRSVGLVLLVGADGRVADCGPQTADDSAQMARLACAQATSQWSAAAAPSAIELSAPYVRVLKVAFELDGA